MNYLRAAVCLLSLASCATAESVLVFAGTYTRTSSKGIYTFRFDPATGAVSGFKLAVETPNPSFLAVHPNGRYLYAVNEVGDFGGQKSGSVSAFAIDTGAGALKPINTVASRGESPAHLAIDPAGKWLVAANYSGGSIAVFPVGADGALGDAVDVLHRTGSSVHARQKGPQPH
jgi:6-phosphogluconolactonase